MQRGEPAWPSRRYAWYVAGVFTLANTLAFSDRQLFALLLQPIERELHLSDFRASLLHGFAFILLYVAVSIPVARVADAWNRRSVVAAAALTWSVMAALCASARSYAALFAARVGVGAGEGGLSPAAQSMLADCFRPQELPAALSLYATGVYLGGGAALVLGGWLYAVLGPLAPVPIPLLGALHGWRLVMLALSLPGALAAIVCATLREPPRRQAGEDTAGRWCPMPWSALRRQFVLRRQAYCGIFLGYGIMIMVGAGTSAWIPTFFARRYHWPLPQVGARYGAVVLVCGVAGALCGGFLAAALRKRHIEGANLRVALAGFVLLTPFAVLYPLVADAGVALALVGGYNFFAAMPFGGGYAALQELTPNRMRAQVLAAFLLLVNLLGQGFGPTLIALCTDYGFGDEMALPKSLALIAAIGSPLAAACLWYARRHAAEPFALTPLRAGR